MKSLGIKFGKVILSCVLDLIIKIQKTEKAVQNNALKIPGK